MLWPGGWCSSCFRDQTLLLYMSNGSQKSQTNTRADIIGKYYDFWQQLNKYFTISYRTELYIILTYLFVQVKMVGYNQFIASAGSLLVWISFISYHAIPTFRPLFRFFIDISMLIHLRVHVWGVLSVLKGNTACKMVHPVDWLTPALSEWDQITVNTKVKSLVFLLVFSFPASLKSWCKIHVFTTITKLFRDLPLSWKFDEFMKNSIHFKKLIKN